MSFTLIKNSISDDKYRDGYYQLAKDTFGLSFKDWYDSGYFDGSHVPYTVFDGDRAVANISVNFMDVVFEGKVKKCVQLGTVMTDKEYRGKSGDAGEGCDGVAANGTRRAMRNWNWRERGGRG